jgi:hypothetical protein
LPPLLSPALPPLDLPPLAPPPLALPPLDLPALALPPLDLPALPLPPLDLPALALPSPASVPALESVPPVLGVVEAPPVEEPTACANRSLPGELPQPAANATARAVARLGSHPRIAPRV